MNQENKSIEDILKIDTVKSENVFCSNSTLFTEKQSSIKPIIDISDNIGASSIYVWHIYEINEWIDIECFARNQLSEEEKNL